MGHDIPMKIESASLKAPPGLRELLINLGSGENGFMGTPVHTGESTIEQYLHHCWEMQDLKKLPTGYVPQTVYWILDSDGIAIGMVRLRHYLNEKLRVHGGHIGFFIHRDHRGKGYATEALRLSLLEFKRLGEKRALLTVDPHNIPSIKVIEKNGGRFEDVSIDPEAGKKINRYWIEIIACRRSPNAAAWSVTLCTNGNMNERKNIRTNTQETFLVLGYF